MDKYLYQEAEKKARKQFKGLFDKKPGEKVDKSFSTAYWRRMCKENGQVTCASKCYGKRKIGTEHYHHTLELAKIFPSSSS